MVIVHFQGKQLLLPILHGDCAHFRGSNCYCLFYMVIIHFQRKQLLLPISHGDCTFSGEATAIAYFTW